MGALDTWTVGSDSPLLQPLLGGCFPQNSPLYDYPPPFFISQWQSGVQYLRPSFSTPTILLYISVTWFSTDGMKINVFGSLFSFLQTALSAVLGYRVSWYGQVVILEDS